MWRVSSRSKTTRSPSIRPGAIVNRRRALIGRRGPRVAPAQPAGEEARATFGLTQGVSSGPAELEGRPAVHGPGGPRRKAVRPQRGAEAGRLAVEQAAQDEPAPRRSEEHTSELQSLAYLVCRLLLEKKNASKRT